MELDEMLLYLGVRTQTEESIRLCYMLDMEAFNMMEANNYKRYDEERYNYECVFKDLLDELGYEKLDSLDKEAIEDTVLLINLDEDDKEFRDQYFTGLERTLLRFNRFDLISFQPVKETDVDGLTANAYLYELKNEFEEAIKCYKKLGLSNRIQICENKMQYM